MALAAGSLDANVLLRLILRDIPAQSETALALLEHKGIFHVADTALIEVIFALERYYEIPRRDIVKYLNLVIAHPQLSLNRQLISTALLHYGNHPKLSFEDCYLAIHAELNSALPLWTFDKKLASQLSKYARQP